MVKVCKKIISLLDIAYDIVNNILISSWEDIRLEKNASSINGPISSTMQEAWLYFSNK